MKKGKIEEAIEAPKVESKAKTYFFPAQGDAPAFSVEATSLEDAQAQYKKTIK